MSHVFPGKISIRESFRLPSESAAVPLSPPSRPRSWRHSGDGLREPTPREPARRAKTASLLHTLTRWESRQRPMGPYRLESASADRPCPSGEPNGALARRGPDSSLVPAARGEHRGFHVSTAASGASVNDRAFNRVDLQAPAGLDAVRVELTRAGEQSLGADARGQRLDLGRRGEVRFVLSSHSRQH